MIYVIIYVVIASIVLARLNYVALKTASTFESPNHVLMYIASALWIMTLICTIILGIYDLCDRVYEKIKEKAQ